MAAVFASKASTWVPGPMTETRCSAVVVARSGVFLPRVGAARGLSWSDSLVRLVGARSGGHRCCRQGRSQRRQVEKGGVNSQHKQHPRECHRRCVGLR